VPDYKRLVEIFHETFQHPVRTYPDAAPDEWELRYALIAEELEEYFQAAQAGDVVEIADALADLIYVVFGAALAHGIPIEEVFYEVHESNMSKLTNDGKVLRREDGKILKSDQYRPPELCVAHPAAGWVTADAVAQGTLWPRSSRTFRIESVNMVVTLVGPRSTYLGPTLLFLYFR
jgi:predicted HAD superfamily Cof-like phosphohydrolase